MPPHCSKRGKGPTHSTKAALETEAVVIAYVTIIDPQSHSFMQIIEEDVKVIRAYHEDQEVDIKARYGFKYCKGHNNFQNCGAILGYKGFMAREMLAKKPEFQKLGVTMEPMERHNKLLLTMVSWLVKKQGGNFQVIQDCTASTSLTPPLVSLGDSFLQIDPPMPLT